MDQKTYLSLSLSLSLFVNVSQETVGNERKSRNATMLKESWDYIEKTF
jgi:hypothetical protein